MRKVGDLKVGDTVKLKSGGPCMTVIRVEDIEAICKWMDKDSHEQKGTYPFEALVACDPKDYEPKFSF